MAQEVSQADLIVQNGLGYDSFMNNIESASPSQSRKVIVAQHLVGLPDSTPNPHLWYDPRTMPAVAKVMASDLSELAPSHRPVADYALTAMGMRNLTPFVNQQVISSLTVSMRQAAQTAGVPVVGVYETMPTPGYNDQSSMIAEVAAIKAAVLHRTSTEHL